MMTSKLGSYHELSLMTRLDHDNLIINYKIIQEIKNGDNFNYHQIATFLQ